MTTPSWKDALPVPPPGGQLQEAWMTSFERPDAGLLVDHLLPSLLGVNFSLSHEVQERTLFFGELGVALEALHGRITVISSPPREERESSQYPWLWRYVSHFTVGAFSRAVQHAKLWAFHWKVDDEDFIELHISSTNLTMPAFKSQLQAGWRVLLPLKPRTSISARRSWGKLVTFLEELGTAAGAVATTRVARLVTLLGRIDRPPDVTFIASIPGAKSAARQLGEIGVSEIHVLTPTIGEWNSHTLSAWSKDVGVAFGKIHLKWISTKNSWAVGDGWTLSTKVNTTLEANGVRVECIPNEARLTEQHLGGDDRWSHAKLYLLRIRQKRRLLVTSANWSPSAWGAGKASPRNFELGVLFDTTWTDLEYVDQPFDPPDTVPFCVDRAAPEERSSPLEWAEATWDGKRIELRARSSDTSTSISVAICFSGGSEAALLLSSGAAAISWGSLEDPPIVARFSQGPERLEVDIVDLRPPAAFAKTPLPEVDPAVAEALREALLLQRYGGPAVDPESISGLSGAHRPPGFGTPASDYSVQAWVDAREGFDVVDRWQAALKEAANDFSLRERVRSDGEELQALYARRKGPAAGLVAEELRWRLEEEA